jgi:hypothetical protein
MAASQLRNTSHCSHTDIQLHRHWGSTSVHELFAVTLFHVNRAPDCQRLVDANQDRAWKTCYALLRSSGTLRRLPKMPVSGFAETYWGGEQAGFGGRNQYYRPATGGRRAKITPTPFDSLLPPGAAVGLPCSTGCAFFHARLCFATRLQGRASRIQVPRVTEQARIPFHVKHTGMRSVIKQGGG